MDATYRATPAVARVEAELQELEAKLAETREQLAVARAAAATAERKVVEKLTELRMARLAAQAESPPTTKPAQNINTKCMTKAKDECGALGMMEGMAQHERCMDELYKECVEDEQYISGNMKLLIEALLEVGGAGTSDTVDNTPFVDRATEAIDRLISNISESESGYVLIKDDQGGNQCRLYYGGGELQLRAPVPASFSGNTDTFKDTLGHTDKYDFIAYAGNGMPGEPNYQVNATISLKTYIDPVGTDGIIEVIETLFSDIYSTSPHSISYYEGDFFTNCTARNHC